MFVQVALLLASTSMALGQGVLGHQGLSQGYGNAYGGNGHVNQAVGGYGHGYDAGQSLYGNQGYGSQGQYGGGLAQQHSAQGGQQGVNDVNHNRGVYLRNKGQGYEKAFSYDKIYNVQDNGGVLNAHGGYFGTNGGLIAQQHGAHGNFGQSAVGGQSHQAGYGQGHQGILNSGYGNYGQNYGQGQQILKHGGHGYGK